MSTQGTVRLKVINGSPEVNKLQNGRYSLSFLCENNGAKEDWYYDNISSILPEYGILQDADFGSGVSEDWEAIPGSVYPDMRLVEAEYVYIPSIGDKRVKLTYETLTASWVEDKAEDTDYELNGLKRVSRTFVALPSTTYDKVVGTSTIDSDGTTLYLGRFKIDETDAKWSLSEIWLEAGALTLQQDFNNSLKQVSVTAFGMTANAVSSELSEVTTNHQLISQVESDYKGIKTSTFNYQIDESITEDYELNGLKRLSITELSSTNFTAQNIGAEGAAATPQVGLYLGTQDIDNGGVIKVRNSVWFESGIVSRANVNSEDGSEVQQITTYLAVEGTSVGPVTRREVRSIEGLPTYTITETLSPDGTSIISEDPKLVSQNSSMRPFPVPGLIRLKESERKITKLKTNTIPATEYETDSINYSFELFGPVDSISKYTTYEFIQTESEIQTEDYTYNGARGLWSPPSWARSTISGIDISGKPFSVSKAYRGYRAPSNLLSFAQREDTVYTGFRGPYTKQVSRLLSIDGNLISSLFIDGYEMSDKVPPIIEISGGPEDPVGNTYVTDVRIVPDFTDDDNIQYYKKYITTAYVNAEVIDEADVSNIANNRLSSYTFVSESNGNLSITLDPTLLASEDDFYVGAQIEIYPRNKDAANKFQELERFTVYDYDSINNKLLLKPRPGYIVPSQLVGLYDGTGDVSVNESYDFARLSITKYATTGTITKVRGAYVFIDSANNTETATYTGWTFKITSGAFDGDTYTISSSYSGRIGLNTILTDIPEAGTTFELIPPQSF